MSTLQDMVEHCEACGTELEIGQIGDCDDCQDESDAADELVQQSLSTSGPKP